MDVQTCRATAGYVCMSSRC